jgi:hypothetical protein
MDRDRGSGRLRAAPTPARLSVPPAHELVRCYRDAGNPEIRSGLVRMLRGRRPEALTTALCTELLRDPVPTVVTIALAHVISRPALHGTIEFGSVYLSRHGPIVKRALLGAVWAFKVSPETRAALIGAIDRAGEWLAGALLVACGYLRESDALISFWESDRIQEATDDTLALDFARACCVLGDPALAPQLASLYTPERHLIVRVAVIEALGTAGGRGCTAALEQIVTEENDDSLRTKARLAIAEDRASRAGSGEAS